MHALLARSGPPEWRPPLSLCASSAPTRPLWSNLDEGEALKLLIQKRMLQRGLPLSADSRNWSQESWRQNESTHDNSTPVTPPIPSVALLRSGIQGCMGRLPPLADKRAYLWRNGVHPLEDQTTIYGLIYDIHIDDDGLVRSWSRPRA